MATQDITLNPSVPDMATITATPDQATASFGVQTTGYLFNAGKKRAFISTRLTADIVGNGSQRSGEIPISPGLAVPLPLGPGFLFKCEGDAGFTTLLWFPGDKPPVNSLSTLTVGVDGLIVDDRLGNAKLDDMNAKLDALIATQGAPV